MKNEEKIREYLGNKYHLYVRYASEEEITWKVYRKYNWWIYDNSKPILEGNKDNWDELLEFAKKHRDYNEGLILSKSLVIIAIINVFVAVANCFLNNVFLRGFINGINFIVILISFIKLIISNKKLKVSELEIKETRERHKKEIEMVKKYFEEGEKGDIQKSKKIDK